VRLLCYSFDINLNVYGNNNFFYGVVLKGDIFYYSQLFLVIRGKN
jgi:hypothetical protein